MLKIQCLRMREKQNDSLLNYSELLMPAEERIFKNL